MRRRRILHVGDAPLLAATAAALLAGGCASTGATLDSGVGDTFFERPPYYAGQRVPDAAGIVHAPIRFQRRESVEAFEPSTLEGRPVAVLLSEMNAWLDSLRGGPALPAAALRGTPPDVMAGCELVPDDECENADDRRPMRVAVGRPSRAWTESAAAIMDETGAGRLLVITLEVGSYLPHQRNWRGQKEVRLGTGYSVDVPWLTALDRPAKVLQLTGALVDRQGRAIRIGAEGLLARRVNVFLGGFGVEALISDEDVATIRTARRPDLPGSPLVWQAALSSLVAELTGRPGPVADSPQPVSGTRRPPAAP
jgi:hypothetical protein